MGSVNTILQANNITRVARGNYTAAVTTQKAFNERSAALTSLSEYSRTLGNSLKLEAAGKEFNEATSQIAAELEARSTDRINSSIAAAERVGAVTAGAAAAGVGGSSVDLLSETVKLQRNVEQELKQEATDRVAKQSGRANAAIIANAANGVDLTQSFGSFDYTVHIAPQAMKRRLGKLIGVAVATFFGGPMAGEAVADAAVASWQASNADYGGAAKSLDSAVANGIKGYQTWSDLQGGDGPNTWFGAVTQKKNQQASAAQAQNQPIKWGSSEDQFGQGFGSEYDWFIGN